MPTTDEEPTYTRDDMARAWSEGYSAGMSTAALSEIHGGDFTARNPYDTPAQTDA